MSGRMLQRVLKEQQAQPSAILEESTGEDLEEDENYVQKPVRNMFDLLGSEARSILGSLLTIFPVHNTLQIDQRYSHYLLPQLQRC